jgi:hypothetical protein
VANFQKGKCVMSNDSHHGTHMAVEAAAGAIGELARHGGMRVAHAHSHHVVAKAGEHAVKALATVAPAAVAQAGAATAATLAAAGAAAAAIAPYALAAGAAYGGYKFYKWLSS